MSCVWRDVSDSLWGFDWPHLPGPRGMACQRLSAEGGCRKLGSDWEGGCAWVVLGELGRRDEERWGPKERG